MGEKIRKQGIQQQWNQIFTSSTKWEGTVERTEKENQHSEKTGCRRKLKILKEKVSVLRYPGKGETSEEFHWCTLYVPYVIGKSHLPNWYQRCHRQDLPATGFLQRITLLLLFYLDTELLYLHWIVNSIWGQNRLKIQLLKGSLRVLNLSNGCLHELVGALHLQLCLRHSLELS